MSRRYPLPVILFFAALLALGLAIHRDYGISWDEPFQRFSGAVTVKHLAERFAPSLVGGEAGRLPALEDYVDRYHGTAFEAPVVALEALLKLTDKRDIFMFRHLLTFLFCFLGMIATYRLAARRFLDWRWGLFTVLFLVLTPRLFAESFYNSKDAVFMAAFAIAMNTAVAFVLKPDVRMALLHALATAFAIDIRIMAVILCCPGTTCRSGYPSPRRRPTGCASPRRAKSRATSSTTTTASRSRRFALRARL